MRFHNAEASLYCCCTRWHNVHHLNHLEHSTKTLPQHRIAEEGCCQLGGRSSLSRLPGMECYKYLVMGKLKCL